MVDPVSLLVRLLAPDASPGAYNDWQLVATTELSELVLGTIALILVLAVVASATGLRRLSAGRRRLLIALRALTAVVVFGLLLMPAIELRAVSKVRSRVALLVDASRSMGLATPSGKTRAELVEDHLSSNAPVFERLRADALLEPGLFGDRLRTLDALPGSLPTEDARTDLAKALNEVGLQSSGRDLGALILYSDGTDTEGMTPESARSIGAAIGAPIYAVGFPADSSAADLAIRRIVADDFAFVHNTVVLDVEVEQRGLELSSVAVSLKHDGDIVASKEARFGPDGRGRVSFEFKPNQIGKLSYQVSVPVQSAEVVKSNNRRSIVIKVIRDRLRVLQVAGRPSWDERFLRELLKRNPNVDLISFFILRSTTDLQKAPQEELALIPFPVQELFTTEIDSFDVVIFQNFTYRPYNMARYLPQIRDYVLRGGSFLMIGGDDGFEDGWYAGTPLAQVLPLRLGGAPPWDSSPYRPRLTKEGRQHPITRIGEPGEPPEMVFRRLPELEGINPTLALEPGSQALLVHPSLPGNPPLVAVREVGKGRTMAVTTDSMWFWRFPAVAEGGAGREFDRFWNNGFRWLIRDPELARVRLRADRSVYAKGESIGAEVRVLGPDYQGLAEADVSAELVRLDDPSAEGKAVSLKTGPEGLSTMQLGEMPPGAYMLRAEARHQGESVGRAEEPIIVEAADLELQAPFPRPDILEALAEGSGGTYVDIDSPMPDVEVFDRRRVEIDRTRRVPIWDTFPALALLLVLAATEWWLRRRGGLL